MKLNEAEAQALVGSTEPSALRRLCVPEVVLTLGSKGAVVVTASDVEHVPATPVVAPVDPTGAGDMFWVAYLVARSEGADPVEAVHRASAATAAFLGSRRTAVSWRS